MNFEEVINGYREDGHSVFITGSFTTYIRDGGFPKSLEFDNADDRNLYVQSVITQIKHP